MKENKAVFFAFSEILFPPCLSLANFSLTPMVLTTTILRLQIDAFQHMQLFVQTMQQQAQHAIATEDQQHKQELHKLMARSAPGPWRPFSCMVTLMFFLRLQVHADDMFQTGPAL